MGLTWSSVSKYLAADVFFLNTVDVTSHASTSLSSYLQHNRASNLLLWLSADKETRNRPLYPTSLAQPMRLTTKSVTGGHSHVYHSSDFGGIAID